MNNNNNYNNDHHIISCHIINHSSSILCYCCVDDDCNFNDSTMTATVAPQTFRKIAYWLVKDAEPRLCHGVFVHGKARAMPPGTVLFIWVAGQWENITFGRLLEVKFGFRFYDADEWLPRDMLRTLKDGHGFSDAQRDVYYSIICDKIDQCLTGVKAPVVVAQATFKNKHRLQILERFPFVQFWWVQASIQSRAKRLKTVLVRVDPAAWFYGSFLTVVRW